MCRTEIRGSQRFGKDTISFRLHLLRNKPRAGAGQFTPSSRNELRYNWQFIWALIRKDVKMLQEHQWHTHLIGCLQLLLFLPHFDVICDLLLNRRMVTWNIFRSNDSRLVNNYSPKWRWLVVDIYRAAKRRGKYPTLATDTEVNSCFSIY